MALSLPSPCKVNLLLNILGKRPDGFHELETIMHPVPLHDELRFERAGTGLELSCNLALLSTGPDNLVHRAARLFLDELKSDEGLRIHLEKRLPVAAGLGGGSANAATTLLGLNQLFGGPVSPSRLQTMAASLGSDVPFFLQSRPALATGRGERVTSLGELPSLRQVAIVLVYPGFGVATAWAYRNLARFPEHLDGHAGRAQDLVTSLQGESLAQAASHFYNSLEAPVLQKYLVLSAYKSFMLERGADVVLMSGSGSSVFALTSGLSKAEQVAEAFRGKFGETPWVRVGVLP